MAIEFDIQVRNGVVKITVGGQSSSQNTGGDGKNSGTATGGAGAGSECGTCGAPVVVGPIVICGGLLGSAAGPEGGDGKSSGTATGGDGKSSGTATGGAGSGGGCCAPVVIGPIVISGSCLGQDTASSDPSAGSQAVTVNPPAQPVAVKNLPQAFTMQPQQETYWCWAAVAVSINDFLNPPAVAPAFTQSTLATQLLEQQGITAPQCSETPGSTVCNQPQRLDVALAITGNLRQNGALFNQHLTFDSIQNWVNAQLPIAARIKWRGAGAHFIALDGYKVTTSGRNMVHVQDPNNNPTSSPGFLDYDFLVEDYEEAGYWDDTYLVIASSSQS